MYFQCKWRFSIFRAKSIHVPNQFALKQNATNVRTVSPALHAWSSATHGARPRWNRQSRVLTYRGMVRLYRHSRHDQKPFEKLQSSASKHCHVTVPLDESYPRCTKREHMERERQRGTKRREKDGEGEDPGPRCANNWDTNPLFPEVVTVTTDRVGWTVFKSACSRGCDPGTMRAAKAESKRDTHSARGCTRDFACEHFGPRFSAFSFSLFCFVFFSRQWTNMRQTYTRLNRF